MHLLALNDYWILGVLAIVGVAGAGVVLALTHSVDILFGQRRHGLRKESTYESGMDPIGDTRRQFNVRFYLVAVLFLVFDVEIVFLYPWASMFTQLSDQKFRAGAAIQPWASDMLAAGYTPMYLFGAMLVFFALLVVGFVYEWRKGLFKWD